VLEQLPARAGVDRQPAHAAPVRQPWPSLAHVVGNDGEPAAERLRSPLGDECSRLRLDEIGQGQPVTRVTQQIRGFRGSTLAGEQSRGTPLQRPEASGRKPRARSTRNSRNIGCS
jgi:hypothetical protein